MFHICFNIVNFQTMIYGDQKVIEIDNRTSSM